MPPNPFILPQFFTDTMNSLLHSRQYFTSGNRDEDVWTTTTGYKKSCVDGLGNLAGFIRGRRLDLERVVKCSVEFGLLEPPQDKGYYTLLPTTSLLTAENMEDLHPNLVLKGYYKYSSPSHSSHPPVVTNLFQTSKCLHHPAPWAIWNPAQKDLPVCLSAKGVCMAAILLQLFMLGKMKHLLDGLGVCLDITVSGTRL